MCCAYYVTPWQAHVCVHVTAAGGTAGGTNVRWYKGTRQQRSVHAGMGAGMGVVRA